MKTDRIDNGGPAFPHSSQPLDAQGNPMCGEHSEWGMTLRDYFAATLAPDARAMDALSDADDQDLLQRYGTEEEIEEGFRHVSPGKPMPVMNIVLRATLEARGRAALRLVEADAMLAARKEGQP